MKKTVITLSILALIASSCKQETKTQAVNSKVVAEQKSEEKQTKKKVKYHFQIDEKTILFFEDGNAQSTDYPDFEITYEEYPNFLLLEKERRDFFDDFGHIEPFWKIINFHKVNSPIQITNFETDTEEINSDQILHINKTCLLITLFDTEEDENSEKSADYYIAMEDWHFFIAETTAKFKEMGVEAIHIPQGKQYVSFALANAENVVIDIRKKQNGMEWAALLYRKGCIPIMYRDGYEEHFEKYLK